MCWLRNLFCGMDINSERQPQMQVPTQVNAKQANIQVIDGENAQVRPRLRVMYRWTLPID